MAGPAWWVGESHPLGNHKGNSGKESEKLSQLPHMQRMGEKKSNVSLIPAGNGSAAYRFLHPEKPLSLCRRHFVLITEFKETVVKPGDSSEMYCSH